MIRVSNTKLDIVAFHSNTSNDYGFGGVGRGAGAGFLGTCPFLSLVPLAINCIFKAKNS